MDVVKLKQETQSTFDHHWGDEKVFDYTQQYSESVEVVNVKTKWNHNCFFACVTETWRDDMMPDRTKGYVIKTKEMVK